MRKIRPARLKRILEQHFEVVHERSNSEEIAIICDQPGCGDLTGNRSVNLKTGLTNCWRCNVGAHITTLLEKQGIEPDDEDLDDFVQIDNPVDLLTPEAAPAKPADNHEISLPAGFTPLAADPGCLHAYLIGKMARRKHLYLEDFIEAGVGFTRTGPWEAFAIFPVYELGRLVYYQGRTYGIGDEGKKTKKFPSKLDVPMGSRYWIYNYDAAVQVGVNTIIIVESILNVLSLRWALKNEGLTDVVPVAVFKHAVSAYQAPKILASRAKELCFMYDGDATESAWKEAGKFSGARHTTVARMPVGVDANDNAELALERFALREEYSPANALLDGLA